MHGNDKNIMRRKRLHFNEISRLPGETVFYLYKKYTICIS
jgi:hypothetical protein